MVSKIARSRRPIGSSAGGAFEQAADVFGREKVRQRAAFSRIAERLGRIGFRPAFALAEAEKTPQRGQAPGDGGFGVARLVHGGHVSAQIEHRDIAGQRRFAAGGLGQIIGQGGQILAITFQRV